MSKKILVVDDEQGVLQSLQQVLQEGGYEAFGAASGKAALEFLSGNAVDMVISDISMPEMDGYQLLKQVKEKDDNTIRIIMGNYAQEKMIFRTVFEGAAKIYMIKPWDNQMVLQTVKSLLETRDTLKDHRVLSLVGKMDGLPTMASTYNKMNQLIIADADIWDIAEVVEKDMAIASKILQVVNSAFFVHAEKVNSVQQAINLLGLTTVKNLALATSVFESGGPPEVEAQRAVFWKHAELTNQITSLIMKPRRKKGDGDSAAVAGLLHNVGAVVLISQLPGEYLPILRACSQKPDGSLPEAELAALQLTHQELGGYLLNWWDMPYPFVEAALYHHDPFSDKVVNRDLVVAVHLANYYAWSLMKKNYGSRLDLNAMEHLGITSADMEKLLKDVHGA